MAKTSYSEKLKSPKWQKKRLEIMNLRGFKCDKCGNEDEQLNVHHRFYIKGREPWEYDNDVFQVLCNKCHKIEHEKKDMVIEVIPEKYDLLISVINEDYSDVDISNLTYFLDNVKNEEDIPDIMSLLSDSIDHGWFISASEVLKDKRTIQELKEDVHMLKYKVDQMFPDIS